MTDEMWARLEAAYAYLREQLTEASTIRGVAVVLTMSGGLLARFPVESVTAAAVVVGALCKIFLPDRLRRP
jgi:hypothetical protein